MPTDEELTFTDHVARLYARRYGMSPMVGRLTGYLMVCDPHEQSIAELADALLASRSAIAGAVTTLEGIGLIHRHRAAGERMDRVRLDMSSPQAMGFDPSEFVEQAQMAREGLRVLGDATPERQELLVEWAAFADFLVARMPLTEKAWKEQREEYRARVEAEYRAERQQGAKKR